MPKKYGAAYLNSLQDGRTVWLDGKKVADVTKHPAFRGTLKTLSSLFDTLGNEETRDRVGFVSPKTGEYVHNAFLVPKTKEELLKRKESFSFWANETYGVMSRLSGYARSLVTGWYAKREYFRQFDPEFPEKITRYYEQARDEGRFITTAILEPQIDRSKQVYDHEDPDALLRVVKETKEGLVVRGAKMIATSAPYAHDVIVAPSKPLQEGDKEYAHFMIVPLNLSGLHIVCRESFHSEKEEEHPLSARFEEMDSVLIFDDVLVPWERVFLYGNATGVQQIHEHQKLNTLANHQTVVRLLAKLEFVAGVGFAIAESIGADGYLHVQEKLGELVTQVESIKGLLVASEAQATQDENGTYWPARVPLQTARNLGVRYYPRALEILQLIGAGGFIQLPSVTLEKNHIELQPLLQKYFRGAKIGASERIRLYQLAWDLIGSQLATRHELYERYYTGDPFRMYVFQYDTYDVEKLRNRIRDFQEFASNDRKGEYNHDHSRTTVPLPSK